MAADGRKCLELRVRGEKWANYPRGMTFPSMFAYAYPLRGRGVVSLVLYVANKIGLDRLLLKKDESCRLPDGLPENIALFWPAPSRSTGRFYGFVVDGRKVVEFVKFATSEEEKKILRREAENTAIAKDISDGLFRVPEVLGLCEDAETLAVRYQAVPDEAATPPVNAEWIARARDSIKRIAIHGYSHGDFSWHNLKASGDNLWVLDWEELRSGAPHLVDEICFETGLAYYWKHMPLQKVLDDFAARYGVDASSREATKLAVEDLHRRRISMGDILKKALCDWRW